MSLINFKIFSSFIQSYPRATDIWRSLYDREKNTGEIYKRFCCNRTVWEAYKCEVKLIAISTYGMPTSMLSTLFQGEKRELCDNYYRKIHKLRKEIMQERTFCPRLSTLYRLICYQFCLREYDPEYYARTKEKF